MNNEGLSPSAKTRVLILGGGFGGLYGALHLDKTIAAEPDVEVTLVGRDELFSGGQPSPREGWLADLTPHLRYNFATGTRWISYVDGGAEVTATGIGPPDLSHTLEINLQADTGVRWLIDGNAAPSVETRYLHLSCAGMDSPNLGLNSVNGMPGISWFSDDTQ
jgi:hypothetical protein